MEYTFAPIEKLDGTSKQEEYPVPPCKLVERFGVPKLISSDDLGTYIFASDSGEIFTVYMIAYDVAEEAVPQFREEFWALPTPVPMSIGGHTGENIGDFKSWLTEQLQSAGC